MSSHHTTTPPLLPATSLPSMHPTMGEVWQGLLPCASPVWVNRHVEKTYHQSGSDGWYELVVTIGGSTTARWDSAVPKAHPTAAVDSPTSVTSGRDAPHLNAGWQIGARSVACHERNYMTRKAHSWQTSRRVVTRSGTATKLCRRLQCLALRIPTGIAGSGHRSGRDDSPQRPC
jgi:hypothetical protein